MASYIENRKKDETSYEKMLKLRRDLNKAVTLLEIVKRREKTKKEMLQLAMEIADKRFQLGDYEGVMLAEAESIPHTCISPYDWETGEEAVTNKKKRENRKRKHKVSTSGVQSKYQNANAQPSYNNDLGLMQQDLFISDDEAHSPWNQMSMQQQPYEQQNLFLPTTPRQPEAPYQSFQVPRSFGSTPGTHIPYKTKASATATSSDMPYGQAGHCSSMIHSQLLSQRPAGVQIQYPSSFYQQARQPIQPPHNPLQLSGFFDHERPNSTVQVVEGAIEGMSTPVEEMASMGLYGDHEYTINPTYRHEEHRTQPAHVIDKNGHPNCLALTGQWRPSHMDVQLQDVSIIPWQCVE